MFVDSLGLHNIAVFFTLLLRFSVLAACLLFGLRRRAQSCPPTCEPSAPDHRDEGGAVSHLCSLAPLCFSGSCHT